VREALLGAVERGAHEEDRLAVLHRLDAPGRETATVAQPLDLVDDRPLGIAGAQEIGVQRMRHALGRHRSLCGDERLSEHLAAVDPVPARIEADASEQVLLKRLEVEHAEQGLEGLATGSAGFGRRRHGGCSPDSCLGDWRQSGRQCQCVLL
jgi:hypothetical protein